MRQLSLAHCEDPTVFWDASFYDQMRQKAAYLLRAGSFDASFQPEDLVHDAFIRLTGNGAGVQVTNGQHYLAIVSRTMKRSIIDRSRAAKAYKRSGDLVRTELTSEIAASADGWAESFWVIDLLEKCTSTGARFSLVARLHFLEGKSSDEIAQLLGVSARTIKRDIKTVTLEMRQHVRAA